MATRAIKIAEHAGSEWKYLNRDSNSQLQKKRAENERSRGKDNNKQIGLSRKTKTAQNNNERERERETEHQLDKQMSSYDKQSICTSTPPMHACQESSDSYHRALQINIGVVANCPNLR